MKTVLMFTKDNEWCRIAREFVAQNFDAKFCIGNSKSDFDSIGYSRPYRIAFRNEKTDSDKRKYTTYDLFEVDYIISYLCPWIIPKEILECAKIAAINFHPAPPKYPGIGGYNFAIYNSDTEYGVTCHKMVENVDSGEIIGVYTFPLYGDETVKTLKERTMNTLLDLFYDVMEIILDSNKLEAGGYKWEHEPYTRKDLQQLCFIDWALWKDTAEGYDKQLRATYFPNARDGPYIKINGKKWRLIPDD